MRSHREIIAWQRAHAVAIGVHRYGAAHWRLPLATVIDQLRRSSLSAELNIVEGYAIGRSARCRNHFRIAFGSAAETAALLEFLIELGAPALQELNALVGLAGETRALTLRLWQRS
jgi:four helix bundle protein